MKARDVLPASRKHLGANGPIVITQVFPDDFHLNTLDQLLPAIARLNPHVNIKAIVVGLMNRLASYSQAESKSESQDEKRKVEEEAVASLLEKVRISKERETEKGQDKEAEHANGEPAESRDDASETTKVGEEAVEEPPNAKTNGVDDSGKENGVKRRGIPANIKLFEIFHGQVTHLVQAQRLPIQDTIALLVSLANLAL